MAEILRRASDLPTWFDLTKYAGAESMDAAGWYEQLSMRRDLSGLVGSPRWDSWKEIDNPPTTSDRCKEILEIIRLNPLPDVSENLLLRIYFYGGAMHEIKLRDPKYSRGVHLATVRELYMTERNIDEPNRDYARNFFAQFDQNDWLDDLPIEFPCKDWIDEPVDAISSSYGFHVNARVNLMVPDKLLVEQFKLMLAELRRSGVFVENYAKFDFSGWIRFGILPYLDLKIWEKEAGIKIPNRVMADAIFPPGEGGEEVVRKTTEKLAKQLLTLKNLETLASLAAQEIAEQNSD